jgi:hypothetical protein
MESLVEPLVYDCEILRVIGADPGGFRLRGMGRLSGRHQFLRA